MKRSACWASFVLLSFATPLLAQNMGPACTLMGALDLKPLLGSDHGTPAPYADTGCMVKSKTPGRLLILWVTEKSPEELKKSMVAMKQELSAPEYAKVGTLAAVPELGPEAFSAREKGEQSAAEIYARKGGRGIHLALNWSNGKITEPIFKQLRELAVLVLAKLP